MLQISELMTLGWLRGDFSLSSSSLSRRGVMSSKLERQPHDRGGDARRRQPSLRPPTERLSFARRLVLGFFCVNGMEPIWTLPSRFGLGITLIYVDWLHYYVHCAHPTLRCEAALIRAAAAASSMSMPLCFGVPKRPPRLPRAHPRGSHRANAF